MSPNSSNTPVRQGYVYHHFETPFGRFTLFKQPMYAFVSITFIVKNSLEQSPGVSKHSLRSAPLQSRELKMPVIDVFTIASDLSLD